MNILITGGSSGLGRAMVEKLAPVEDYHIIFTYCHNIDAAKYLENSYKNVQAYPLDYNDLDSIDRLVNEIPHLNIDILINNAYAGTALGTHFHKTDINDFTTAFNTNIIPFIKITQACLSYMRKQKFGKIVNIITSYVIDVPPAGFSVYTATKAYIRQLSKSICKEYGRYNITSNCILPDYMPTAFGKVEDFQLEQMQAAHPLKKLLQPEEVADVVAHLILLSQQVNGVEFPINAAQNIM